MDMLLFKKALVGFELLASIVGLVNWQKIKHDYFISFPIYLLLIAILEIICFWRLGELAKILDVFILIPLEFLFFFWLFYKNSQKKRLILIGSFVYLISFIVEIFIAERINKGYFLSFSYSIGNIVLLVFILQYFYYLVFTERILFFYRERMFWVALGLLVFYLGTFPYFGLYNLLVTKHFKLLISYTWVEIFLDYTMYLLFAASFIWGREK